MYWRHRLVADAGMDGREGAAVDGKGKVGSIIVRACDRGSRRGDCDTHIREVVIQGPPEAITSR